ncbi:hypothetical protein StrepF001_11970 [Streptomyces sp. F001]|nr:hypothetical protein StrepF001_11970 [Streptomyces sp. F001]
MLTCRVSDTAGNARREGAGSYCVSPAPATTVLLLPARDVFRLSAYAAALACIVAFGTTEALTNFFAGTPLRPRCASRTQARRSLGRRLRQLKWTSLRSMETMTWSLSGRPSVSRR